MWFGTRLLLVALLLVGMSGLAATVDLVARGAPPACCGHEESPMEDGEDQCPPSCIACPRPAPLAPVRGIEFKPVVPRGLPTLAEELEIQPPSEPHSEGIFHPPRATR